MLHMLEMCRKYCFASVIAKMCASSPTIEVFKRLYCTWVRWHNNCIINILNNIWLLHCLTCCPFFSRFEQWLTWKLLYRDWRKQYCGWRHYNHLVEMKLVLPMVKKNNCLMLKDEVLSCTLFCHANELSVIRCMAMCCFEFVAWSDCGWIILRLTGV